MVRPLGAQPGGGVVAEALMLVAPLRGPLGVVGAPQPQCPPGVDYPVLAHSDVMGSAPPPVGVVLGEAARPLPVLGVRVRPSCLGAAV